MTSRSDVHSPVTALLRETGTGWAFTLDPFHSAHTVATLQTAYTWQPLDLGNPADPNPDEQVVLAAAAAACRAHPRGPRIQVYAGPVEAFDSITDPPGADIWRADPTAPDPPRDFIPYTWWRWQQEGANPDDEPPRTGS